MPNILKKIKSLFINKKCFSDKKYNSLLDIKSAITQDWKEIGGDLNNVLKEWKKSYVKK